MVDIRYRDMKNPYDFALEAIENAQKTKEKVSFSNGEDYFQLHGDTSNLSPTFLKWIISPTRDISTIRNYQLQEIKTVVTQEGVFKDHQIKIGDVFMVNFGQPLGGEFGYEHPAIVIDSPARDLLTVIPVSSKLRAGKEVLQFRFDDPKILENPEPLFLKRSRGVISYVIINEKRSISVKRIEFYVGHLANDVLDLVLGAPEGTKSIKDTKKENISAGNPETKEINFDKFNFSFEEKKFINLELNEKLAEIINSGMSQEAKVYNILNIFGINRKYDAVAQYIYRAVLKAMEKGNFSFKKVCENFAYGKKKTPSEIASMIEKRIRECISYCIFPSAEAFVTFVAKLACAKEVTNI